MKRHTPPEVFRAGLLALNLSTNAFSRIFGLDPRNTRRWVQDGEDIPAWVGPALAALTAPGALELASRAGEHLDKRATMEIVR